MDQESVQSCAGESFVKAVAVDLKSSTSFNQWRIRAVLHSVNGELEQYFIQSMEN